MTRLNTLTIALMPVAIVLNIVIGYLVGTVLKLPLYLDSLGTILVGALAGPLAGGLTGLLSNVLWTVITGGTASWFALVAGLVGVAAGLFGARGWFQGLGRTALAGIVTGIIAAIVAGLIQAYLLGGISGGGTDVLTAFYLNQTGNVTLASLLQSLTVDPIDKLIQFVALFFLVRGLPRRLLVRFPQGKLVAPPLAAPPITEAYRKRTIGPKED